MSVGFLCELVKRIGWMDSLEDGNFEMVVKVVFGGVSPDFEIVGDGLAVDCVEQRVKLSTNG